MLSMASVSAAEAVAADESNISAPGEDPVQTTEPAQENKESNESISTEKPQEDQNQSVASLNDKVSEEPESGNDAGSPKKAPMKKKTPAELREFIKTRVEQIKEQETFDNKVVLDSLKGISKTYFNYKKERKNSGVLMCSLGFPAQVLKMLRWFNSTGVFKNDDIWFPTYYSYNICWNYTDASRDLAMELASAGMIQICKLNITHEPYLENSKSKNVNYLLKSSLSILQNLAKLPELREVYEEEGVKDALQPFLSHENEFYKAVSTMILTALLSEEENSRLENTGCMEFIIRGLRSALKSKTRRYRGFSPEELTECLARMAVNDSNKKNMVSKDVLPLLLLMLECDIPGEQLAACQTLWNLAFDKEVASQIKAEAGLTDAIEKMSNGENVRIKKMAKGALWVLNEADRATERKPSAESGSGGHIFISYSWAQQEEIVQIKDALKYAGYKVWFDMDENSGTSMEAMAKGIKSASAAGYKVWIDLEMMGGSTLEAMADGVDKATVMLVCASEAYKLSPNARAEAEYAFQLKKPVVPVMMQRKYKPDGWLGMIMGAKLYINFDGKYPFEKAFAMLEKELAGRGKGMDVVDKPAPPPQTLAPAPPPPRPDQAIPAPAPAPTKPRLPATSDWDKVKVSEYLSEHGLESKRPLFSEYDGKLLAYLAKVRQEVPEFFYKYLQETMKLDMLDICRLISALEELPT